MSTFLKTVLTFVTAILVIYVCYGKILMLNATIGSLWININIYYLIATGMLLPFLFFSFKKALKIPYFIILILLLIYVMLLTFDGLNNLIYQSLIIYILLLIFNSFVIERIVKKRITDK